MKKSHWSELGQGIWEVDHLSEIWFTKEGAEAKRIETLEDPHFHDLYEMRVTEFIPRSIANQLMLGIFALLLALAILAACANRPAPEPDRCYTLVLACGSSRVEYRVSRHWTELRPPNLYMVCWVRCGTGTRGCTSLDGCTFYHRW